jgi:hypothetical protein
VVERDAKCARRLGLLLIFCSFASFALAQGSPFREINSKHFVAQYTLEEERGLAQKVLDRAELYYDKVARDIGYSRYQNFWTWESRVKIVIFPDQVSFARFTGQPGWSKGYASRDSRLFRDRAIVTYDGQPELLEEILPHEIAHLIFWDYLGFNDHLAPLWFEEGVAQLEEPSARARVQEAMKGVVQAGQHISFSTLMDARPEDLRERLNLSLFYAESLSVVVFLIEKYGQDAFYRLSRELKDGKDFNTAFTRSYSGIFDSFASAEGRWKQYLLEQP